jgi:hypothetical protein
VTSPAAPLPPDAQRVDGVETGAVVVVFAVVVRARATEAPRVSVKPAGGARGVVDIIGVEERARLHDDVREIAFCCEAERGAVAFDVDVVVDRPGQPLLHLPGPHVAALGAA